MARHWAGCFVAIEDAADASTLLAELNSGWCFGIRWVGSFPVPNIGIVGRTGTYFAIDEAVFVVEVLARNKISH
tara:strand:+ start:164 stop:385 length:222 start_codon:yes stop_codon:yes gene_type:complete